MGVTYFFNIFSFIFFSLPERSYWFDSERHHTNNITPVYAEGEMRSEAIIHFLPSFSSRYSALIIF